jgi:hypothetical protein
MIIEMLGRYESRKFSDIKSKKDIDRKYGRFGIYVVRILKGNLPRHFRRLNGVVDKEGILCIGKSNNLRNRIWQFHQDVNSPGVEDKYHSEGRTFRMYFRYDPENPKKLGLDAKDMEIIWKTLDNKEQAEKWETELIDKYLKTFQDKPPLNISIKRNMDRVCRLALSK